MWLVHDVIGYEHNYWCTGVQFYYHLGLGLGLEFGGIFKVLFLFEYEALGTQP